MKEVDLLHLLLDMCRIKAAVKLLLCDFSMLAAHMLLQVVPNGTENTTEAQDWTEVSGKYYCMSTHLLLMTLR